VKSRDKPADRLSMLVLSALLTVSYFAAVVWFLRTKRRAARALAPCLPDDDQAPASAIGWPPEGARLTAYVDEGFSALDAYLALATPPESS
jgi:hypothetical protein